MKFRILLKPLLVFTLLVLSLTSLTSCTLMKASVAYVQPLDDFKALPLNDLSPNSLSNTSPKTSLGKIYYLPGAEVQANKIAQWLPDAIREIEQKQYKPFTSSPQIYVCATLAQFATYSGAGDKPKGTTFNNKIFISPRADKEGDLRLIVTHELSHLQFMQYLGRFQYANRVPVWFQEGLAVYASDGGGATSVTVAEAEKAIVAGQTFQPGSSGSVVYPRTAYTFGMKPPMFYRQSELFVSYLHQEQPEHFKQFVLALLSGAEFKPSFETSFNRSVKITWQSFVVSLKRQDSQKLTNKGV